MIWLWLACTAPQDLRPISDTGGPLPGTEKPVTEPEWDLAAVESELEWLLSQGFPSSR